MITQARPSGALTAYKLLLLLPLARAFQLRAHEVMQQAVARARAEILCKWGAELCENLLTVCEQHANQGEMWAAIAEIVQLLHTAALDEAELARNEAAVTRAAAARFVDSLSVTTETAHLAIQRWLGIEVDAPASSEEEPQGAPEQDPLPPHVVAFACSVLAQHSTPTPDQDPEVLAEMISARILLRITTAEECQDIAVEIGKAWKAEGRDVQDLPHAIAEAIRGKYPGPSSETPPSAEASPAP